MIVVERSAQHFFAGEECPTCRALLRLVGGGQASPHESDSGTQRIDVYRCSAGHEFHAHVRKLQGGEVATRGLFPGSGCEEAGRVHFA